MPQGEESSYRFVESSRGSSPTSNQKLRRAVRSHAASVSQPDHVTRQRNRIQRLNNPDRGIFVFGADRIANSTATQDAETLPLIGTGSSSSALIPAPRDGSSYLGQHLLDPSSSPWSSLSGQTLSPIADLATYHKSYVPGIIDHYVRNLTIPIPEIDGTSTVPLFRAAWLPVVAHDPLIFQIIVLFAATHYATYADPSRFNSLHLELLSLKQSALSALIRKVQSEQRAPSSTTSARGIEDDGSSSDALIAAAAKMASFEAIFGAVEAVSKLHILCYDSLRR